MPTSTNRTKWPVQGGAISVQPGWFQGHLTAFFYLNLGLGATPPNMSHPMLPPFEIIGPSSNPYPGTFCLPQVPLPANITVNVGDLATIQVVETAKHGAALYNVCFLLILACLIILTPSSVSISNLPNHKTASKSRPTTASTRRISNSAMSTLHQA